MFSVTFSTRKWLIDRFFVVIFMPFSLIPIQVFRGFELDWFLKREMSLRCEMSERKEKFLLSLTFWLVRHTQDQNIESNHALVFKTRKYKPTLEPGGSI